MASLFIGGGPLVYAATARPTAGSMPLGWSAPATRAGADARQLSRSKLGTLIRIWGRCSVVLPTHFLRICSKPSQSGPELVAHHVAGAAGGGKLLAEFVERGPIVVGNGDDVALRPAHPWQLPKQHDRLTVADQ
jgi:hypothetical protein